MKYLFVRRHILLVVYKISTCAYVWCVVMLHVDCIQDFSGFRVVVLFSRFRPNWPAPGAYDTEGRRASDKLGGQKNPLPMLLMDGKPVSAATVRW